MTKINFIISVLSQCKQ